MISKAVFLEKPNTIDIRETELPGLTEGLLLEVYAAGVCGTDPHIVNGSRETDLPIVLGHEFYGKVIDIHPNCDVKMTTGRLEKNQLITIVPGRVCGTCYYCLNYPNDEHLCTARKVYGVNLLSSEYPVITGGFSRYVTILNGYHIHPVPKKWRHGLGALLEPFSVGVRAALRGIEYYDKKPRGHNGKLKVLIQGCGTIGFSILLTLHGFADIETYVVEPIEHRCNRALKYGATKAFKPDSAGGFIEEIKSTTGILGFDIVFEAAGTIEAVNQAFGLVRRGGCIIEVGNFANVGSIEIPPSMICRNDIAFIGSVLGPPPLYGYAESIIEKIKNNVDDLLGPIFQIDDAPAAIHNVSKVKDGLKTLIVPKEI